jgi:hypothetical protein
MSRKNTYRFQTNQRGVPVIERLKETGGVAFGFKVVGKLLDEELKTFEPQLEFFIAQHKKHPIGILVDLTEMRGAEWKARWDDLRFLQKHTSHIARMAVVGAHHWEELVELFTSGAAVLQSETRYFESKCRTPGNGREPRSTLKMLLSA